MADEPKLFPPSPEFQKNAYFKSMDEYEAAYKRSVEDPEGYWAERAKDALVWTKDWDTVLDWSFDPKPYIKWFEGGELNAAYNCVDRHVEAGKGDKAAIVFEGDPGDTYTIHVRRSSRTRSASSPTSSRSTASRRVTASPSTCR